MDMFKPNTKYLTYNAVFLEPQMKLITEDLRLAVVGNIVKYYQISIDDIKVKPDNLSKAFISFSKLIDNKYFELSLGVEQLSAAIGSLKTMDDLCEPVDNILSYCGTPAISTHQITYQSHLEIEGNVHDYLNSFFIKPPAKFGDKLSGSGVQFFIKYPEYDFTVFVSIASSMQFENSIYLFIDYRSTIKNSTFNEFISYTNDKHHEILTELGIIVAEESNGKRK